MQLYFLTCVNWFLPIFFGLAKLRWPTLLASYSYHLIGLFHLFNYICILRGYKSSSHSILILFFSFFHTSNTYFGSLDGSKAMMTILVDICGWKDLQHGWTYWLVTQTSHCCRFLSTILWVLTLFSDNALIHALLCFYIIFAYLILYWFIKVWAWSPASKY